MGLPSLLRACLPGSPLPKDLPLLRLPSEGSRVSASVRRGREPGSVLSNPAALRTGGPLHGVMPPGRP